MTKLIKGTCPQCGAPVEFDENADRATCEYCGTSFVVDKNITNINIDNSKNKSTTVNILSGKKKEKFDPVKAEMDLIKSMDSDERQKYLDRKDANQMRAYIGMFLVLIFMAIMLVVVKVLGY